MNKLAYYKGYMEKEALGIMPTRQEELDRHMRNRELKQRSASWLRDFVTGGVAGGIAKEVPENVDKSIHDFKVDIGNISKGNLGWSNSLKRSIPLVFGKHTPRPVMEKEAFNPITVGATIGAQTAKDPIGGAKQGAKSGQETRYGSAGVHPDLAANPEWQKKNREMKKYFNNIMSGPFGIRNEKATSEQKMRSYRLKKLLELSRSNPQLKMKYKVNLT